MYRITICSGCFAVKLPHGGSALRRLSLLPVRLAPVEELLQLALGIVERLLARGRQVLARAVDVEGEHGERRAIGIGLAAMAALGGALQRGGDLLRIVEREDAFLQVQRIAFTRDAAGPLLCFARLFLLRGHAGKTERRAECSAAPRSFNSKINRHGRACPGHPLTQAMGFWKMDGVRTLSLRTKGGHDDGG